MKEQVDILLVEDEPALGIVLSRYLCNQGFTVIWSKSAEEAFDKTLSFLFRLMIIDVQLPKEDGFRMAARIKEMYAKQPFLFLTALAGKENRKRGLALGAFDYIEKPFEMDELMLKIQNILHFTSQASSQSPDDEMVVLGNMVFYKNRLALLDANGVQKNMTVREAEILAFLIERQNSLVLKKDILLKFWGDSDYFNGKSLEVFISRLRKLLKEESRIKIDSVYGAGYILVTP
ncbi:MULTISPECIES: response regulator transcription factor [Sphingobacterium]|uniref:Response regulator transcription factor n=1 Tax=Sphingobacterium populi TaxID=1812824 RepID=A0ABW5UEQ6_9SPHI|nr:response regulator transcription factor [Sphingobacterium sp. CFCC 11742]